jgi:cytochrome c oxidase accessory protein FixG
MQIDPARATAAPAPGVEVLLYQSAARIQSRQAKGIFANLRVIAMLALLGLYYLLPWLSWNGRPLVHFDLPNRRFDIFTITLVPQDLPLLAVTLLTAALTLFLFTSLAGRLWCGYACPQTVWTEAFIWMEQLCEGDRYDRIKLDRSAWNGSKILRRGSKHALWLVFSMLTGLTFVSYFIPARELYPAAANFELSGWSLFWSLFYGFATWGNAGFMREQVCKYMCPYARFQSAMFDRDTLIISYDARRGEPRKSKMKKLMREPGPAASLSGEVDSLSPSAATIALKAGDCIDCSLCVQVCPMGIDIRNGLQYECIACAACIDACNTVMDSVNKPRELIRYSTARKDNSGEAARILRGRTIGYGVVWLAACSTLLILLLTHSSLRFDVLRDRHTLYREMADGSIENVYTIKLTNSDRSPHRYRIHAEFADGTPLQAEPEQIEDAAEETESATIALRTPTTPPAAGWKMVEPVTVELVDEDNPGLSRKRGARFLTGAPR